MIVRKYKIIPHTDTERYEEIYEKTKSFNELTKKYAQLVYITAAFSSIVMMMGMVTEKYVPAIFVMMWFGIFTAGRASKPIKIDSNLRISHELTKLFPSEFIELDLENIDYEEGKLELISPSFEKIVVSYVVEKELTECILNLQENVIHIPEKFWQKGEIS